MAKKLKPSKFIYDRIKSLGFVHPSEGYAKAMPSHVSFRYSLYKTAGILFLMYAAFMAGTSF